MTNYLTIGKLTTCTRAWIPTFIFNTCSICRTIGIYHTFRSTDIVRIANVVWKTATRTSIVSFFANSVHSTRRWIARIYRISNFRLYVRRALYEWITMISRDTNALWCMTHYLTFCIHSTRSYARIFTFIIDTC